MYALGALYFSGSEYSPLLKYDIYNYLNTLCPFMGYGMLTLNDEWENFCKVFIIIVPIHITKYSPL